MFKWILAFNSIVFFLIAYNLNKEQNLLSMIEEETSQDLGTTTYKIYWYAYMFLGVLNVVGFAM